MAMMNKILFLEWGRGIAAILVVLHHATLDAPSFYNAEPFNNFFYFGMAGVDFFFVLSGFIMYYIHSEDNIKKLKKYLFKRVIRIYPIYILITFTLFCAYYFFPQLTNREGLYALKYIVKSFLLFPTEMHPILTVSWTLQHEMFFYFLFMLFMVNKKLGWIVFTIWGGSILMFNIFVQDRQFPYSFYFNIHNIEFILGLLVAYFIKKNIFLRTKKDNILLFYASSLLFLLNGLNVNYGFLLLSNLNVTLIYAISSALILLSLVRLNAMIQIKLNHYTKLLTLLGSASYVIYLIHLPLQSLLHRIVVKLDFISILNSNIIFLLICLISIVVGILVHVVLEKPIINFFKK